MARLDFDFHARPAQPGKVGIALALTGLAALVWAWSNLQAARATEAGLAAQIAAAERARPQAAQHAARPDAARAAQAHIADQLAFAWQPAFEAVSAARSNKIALLSLDAVQAKAQLKLVAEARQLADAVAFIDVLQQQPRVRRATLIQHEVQDTADQKPVRFTILVELTT